MPKGFGYILDASDASELMELSPRNNHHDRLYAVRFVLYRPNRNLENFFSNLIQCRQRARKFGREVVEFVIKYIL
jgi:hypothetical protein